MSQEIRIWSTVGNEPWELELSNRWKAINSDIPLVVYVESGGREYKEHLEQNLLSKKMLKKWKSH